MNRPHHVWQLLILLPLCPQYYNDFGDIIKVTLFRTRQMDKIESARLLVHCVQEVESLCPLRCQPSVDMLIVLFIYCPLSAVCPSQAEAGERHLGPPGRPDLHLHQGAGAALLAHLQGPGQVQRERGADPQVRTGSPLDLSRPSLGTAQQITCPLCRSGIEFVFKDFIQTPDMPAPPYLSYLTILSEFSSKLLRPDKKAL